MAAVNAVNASGPCGPPPHSVCQNGGSCIWPEPEPEPERLLDSNGTAGWRGDDAGALDDGSWEWGEAGVEGHCLCPQGWVGTSCEQLDLLRADFLYASASVALVLCLVCCMLHGDPERRRAAVLARENGYRSGRKLGDDAVDVSRRSSCTSVCKGAMDSLAALPLRWKLVWAVGSLCLLGLSLTILVVVPGSFLIILGLWTACIVRVGSQYSGSLLDPAGDGDQAMGSGFELATFSAADVVSRSDDLGTSLLHSSGAHTDAQGGAPPPKAEWTRHHSMSGYGQATQGGKTWQEKVRDAPHGKRAESAAFSTF
eukprot:COSAG02_NODE_5767_length_4055_cov_2.085693_2_plen_312_part_00